MGSGERAASQLDTERSQTVTVDELTTAVSNNAPSGCPGGQSVCGNGIKEFAPETLTSSQAFVCSLNSAIFKVGSTNCELCDDGNTSDCGTCDHTCGTATALGAKTCPVGTTCVDDQDCTGTCDPATGKCVAECGNGVVETPEACDDGNTDACGPCNTTCSAAGAGTCPAMTGCNADAVCTSGMCVNKVCQ